MRDFTFERCQLLLSRCALTAEGVALLHDLTVSASCGQPVNFSQALQKLPDESA
ncbi:MAG: hypothetical protein JOZ68_04505 [Acidimicrobiia bacterium]|nr:hypothetical protein [Acidimicrobiia bacterium]